MEENPPHFGIDSLCRPIRMLRAQPSDLHFARRPIEALRQLQPPLTRHGTQDLNLFRAGLFIRQHEESMRPETPQGKPD
jgi:hypothetical protein